MQRHTLCIPKTARFFTEGQLTPEVKEVWFCFHGYAQVADAFLEEFRTIRSPARLFVAPEGLSRFYRRGGSGPIGASWMTSIDRTDEIDDYVRFVDAVHDGLLQSLKPEVGVHALGFSQGAATAARWALLGHARVHRLTLWGEGLPPDLDLLSVRAKLGGLELSLVRGTRDPISGAERRRAEEGRLRASGVPYRCVEFEGGHELDEGVLGELAGC